MGTTEEENVLVLTLGTLTRLNPLARPAVVPEGGKEAEGTTLGVAPVVDPHHLLDSLRCLVGVVERDGADVVVKHVCLDDPVQKLTTDEAELTVDSGGGATDEVPGLGVVVRELRVGVLEESDCDCGWKDCGVSSARE